MQKSHNIIISHVYSFDNKGDAALLSVLISDVRKKFGNVSITILTLDTIKQNETFDGATVRHSFMFYAMKRFQSNYLILPNSLFIMLATLAWAYTYRLTGWSLPIGHKLVAVCLLYAKADLIVPVGGGYIRSQKKGLGSLLNVALLLHPLKLSHVLKKPTVLYTQSVGPFTSVLEERMVSHALNTYAEAALVREDTSMKLLKRIGAAKKAYRSIDSGFAFTTADATYDVRKLLGIPANKIVFGVTARSWLPGPAQAIYENALAKAVKYIVEKYQAAVVFIPQVTAEFHGDDDRIVHRRITQKIGNVAGVYSIEEKLNHHQIKAVYNSLDLVIGTRFHSVIFSLTSYVPAVAIEYEHKTGGIMHDLGLDEWVIKIENVTASNLIEKVDYLVANRAAYRRKLKRDMPEYVAKTKNAIEIVAERYTAFTK